MCGRYASSRQPDDLIEEFEVVESRIGAPLDADYNVAPTKEVYAVVDEVVRRTLGEEQGWWLTVGLVFTLWQVSGVARAAPAGRRGRPAGR